MLKNYLLTSLRNIKKEPGYAVLNLLGLTLGISASLVIFLYLQYELNFDTYHEKGEQIYRISSDIKEPDNAFRWSVTQMPLGRSLKMEYAEVAEYVRFIPNGNSTLTWKEQNFFEEGVYFVDSTVFDVFSFDFILGNKETALDNPNSLVLSESVARKIFGEENPIGEQIEIDNDESYQVTGIYRDMPQRSHIIASGMLSANTLEEGNNAGNWGGFNIYTYVLLNSATSYKEFEAKLAQTIEKYVDPIFESMGIRIRYEVLPLFDIHLHSDFEGEPQPTGNIAYIYIFSAIGLFLILIACINFINLSTARSSQRALEVGIRKVMGSLRSQLIAQFLGESLVYAFLSLLVSVLLVFLLIPGINSLLGLELSRSMLATPGFWLFLIAIMVGVGVLGGSYPAFFLSGFAPIAVLKGKYTKGSGKNPLRKALVVLQFIVSLFLLIGTGIIYDQLNYVRTKDLGFDQDRVLVVPFTNRTQRDKWPVLRDALLDHSEVIQVATATSSPGLGYGKNIMTVELEEGGMDERGVDVYWADYDYLETLGMSLVEGRGFSSEFSTDTIMAALANEAMVRRMGWTEPVGKKIRMDNGGGDSIPFREIIGVIKDYHHQSLYDPISALVIFPSFNLPRVHIKVQGDKLGPTLEVLASTWDRVYPNVPFEYTFIDEEFQSQYEEDQKRGKIFLIFSIMAIGIACLGLLGLAAYTTILRTKEISIRKVVGAKTQDILQLLTRDYLLLIGIAAIPAFVLVWVTMQRWLESFAYHTSMNFFLYGAAFVFMCLVTLFTTGYYAFRAAQLNPADALKNE